MTLVPWLLHSSQDISAPVLCSLLGGHSSPPHCGCSFRDWLSDLKGKVLPDSVPLPIFILQSPSHSLLLNCFQVGHGSQASAFVLLFLGPHQRDTLNILREPLRSEEVRTESPLHSGWLSCLPLCFCGLGSAAKLLRRKGMKCILNLQSPGQTGSITFSSELWD